MDLFKEVLPMLDKSDLNSIRELSDDNIKKPSGFVIMKFMSAVTNKNRAAYNILAVNSVVNRGFWALGHKTDPHDRLKLLLLSLCGSGRSQSHYFPGKSLQHGKLFDFVRKCNPLMKEDEINMLLTYSTKQELIDIGITHGLQAKALKELTKNVTAFKDARQ